MKLKWAKYDWLTWQAQASGWGYAIHLWPASEGGYQRDYYHVTAWRPGFTAEHCVAAELATLREAKKAAQRHYDRLPLPEPGSLFDPEVP